MQSFLKKKMILWIEEWKEHANNHNKFKNIVRKNKYIIGRYLIRNCDALIVGGIASKKFAKSIGKKDEQIFLAMQCSDDLMIANGKWHKKREKPFTFLYLALDLYFATLTLSPNFCSTIVPSTLKPDKNGLPNFDSSPSTTRSTSSKDTLSPALPSSLSVDKS